MRVKIPAILILPLLLIAGVGCTNYSTEEREVNPPILLAIEAITGGYKLTVIAQNIEIGFMGYRLYQGITEEDSRSRSDVDGIDCSSSARIYTNQSIQYYIEVVPGQTIPSSSDYICSVPLQLTPGTWIHLRSLLMEGFGTLKTSIPGNALPVP